MLCQLHNAPPFDGASHTSHTHLHFLNRLCEHFKIRIYLSSQILVVLRRRLVITPAALVIGEISRTVNIRSIPLGRFTEYIADKDGLRVHLAKPCIYYLHMDSLILIPYDSGIKEYLGNGFVCKPPHKDISRKSAVVQHIHIFAYLFKLSCKYRVQSRSPLHTDYSPDIHGCRKRKHKAGEKDSGSRPFKVSTFPIIKVT